MASIIEYIILARKGMKDNDEEGMEIKVGDMEVFERGKNKLTEEYALEYASALAPENFIYYAVIKYTTSDTIEHNVVKRKVLSNEEFGEWKLVAIQRNRVPRPQRNEEFLAERRDSLGMNE